MVICEVQTAQTEKDTHLGDHSGSKRTQNASNTPLLLPSERGQDHVRKTTTFWHTFGLKNGHLRPQDQPAVAPELVILMANGPKKGQSQTLRVAKRVKNRAQNGAHMLLQPPQRI